MGRRFAADGAFAAGGERFWLCERRHGLLGHDHVSLFSWSEQALPGGAFLVELTEFSRPPFYRGGEHLHFYYHEMLDNHWQPARPYFAHRNSPPGARPRRAGAPRPTPIAAALAEALGGVLLPR